MAVINSPFESKYGFKGPGFLVDNFGNIIANSITTSVAGAARIVDFTVTQNPTLEPTDYAIAEVTGINPTITLARSSSYIFLLDVPTLEFKIYAENRVTLYSTGLTHSDGSSGTEAQGKTSGTLVFSIATDAPDTLYYGNNNGTIFGSINVVDPVGVFSSVDINETTASTSSTTGALTVAGGVGIAGDLYVGGTLNIDGIGITKIKSSTNLELEAANQIVVKIDGDTLGIIKSTGSTVPVVDTTINNTAIGTTIPSTASFTSASVENLPTTDSSIANRQYVDSTALALSIAFGL
jgi:cytoskeletal protein CcmA (bactofilin family)